MTKGSDIERAKALAAEAIALCDELGFDLPAAHLQMGLDMLPSHVANGFRIEGLPIVAWTVRDAAQWEAIREDCDNLIFEGFRP